MKPYNNQCDHLKDQDCLLDSSDVAARYRRAEKTLANWASMGYGPPSEKIGGRRLYRLCCLRTWEAQQRAAREAAS